MLLEQLQNLYNILIQPVMAIMLLGTGIYLTFKLRFIQFWGFRRGMKIVRGDYDDPEHEGDVSHFQALTTALSATVGIGNIAGVALAIHFGGPGAIFWMWVTATLGMATKFTEVTLAQRFRKTLNAQHGTIAGGPMYYIEYGLGPNWKPLAAFVAFFLMITALLSGNAIQANTMADSLYTTLNIPTWLTGGLTGSLILIIILGGIKRIGKVTSIVAPIMGTIYIIGGLIIILGQPGLILPALQSIVVEAFQPTAGIAGTGIGIFLQTLTWGIRRGLFSNEAGQGSAPIAHSAAKNRSTSQ